MAEHAWVLLHNFASKWSRVNGSCAKQADNLKRKSPTLLLMRCPVCRNYKKRSSFKDIKPKWDHPYARWFSISPLTHSNGTGCNKISLKEVFFPGFFRASANLPFARAFQYVFEYFLEQSSTFIIKMMFSLWSAESLKIQVVVRVTWICNLCQAN